MKIQFILRESTIKDIIDPWCRMGGDNNAHKGGFTFDDVIDHIVKDGVIQIKTSDATYIYNISDFYRIKIIDK